MLDATLLKRICLVDVHVAGPTLVRVHLIKTADGHVIGAKLPDHGADILGRVASANHEDFFTFVGLRCLKVVRMDDSGLAQIRETRHIRQHRC